MEESGLVGSGIEAADGVEDGRAEFDPGAMPGSRQRSGRVQGIGFGLLEEFEDDGGFENHFLRMVMPDAEQRHLAERRDGLEPLRLVGKVDMDPLERHAFLGKRDRGALDVGAQMMADEGELAGHFAPPSASLQISWSIGSFPDVNAFAFI